MSDFILFEDDWQAWPTAKPHWASKNESAVKLAAKMRTMKVRNNLFFLALLDQTLANVDPFSPNLTAEQMERIGVECIRNPWYFFREIARTPPQPGGRGDPVEFNRANVSMWWSFFNHATYILTQPRQTGKSFCTDVLMTGLMNFWTTNTQINLMTKDDKLRTENIDRLKKMYEELPDYVKFKTRDDISNTEGLSIKKHGNTYRTHVPQSSEKGANNLGRGMTTPIMHIDEAPFQRHIKIALEAALGSMGAAMESSERSGSPYGIVFTTTAGKRDDKDGAYVYKYVQDAASWSESFYDAKNENDLRRQVIKKCPGKVKDYRIYGSFTHLHLGKNDEWLAKQLLRTGATGDAADRDYFNVWTSGNSASPIPTHLLELMKKHMDKPVSDQVSRIGAYWTRWYIPEDKITEYMANNDTVVGLDCSDGVGNDELSFVLTDALTGKVIAVNSIGIENLSTYSAWLCGEIERFPRMTVVFERRSAAVGIIDYLLFALPLKGIDPFKRMFNWVVNDPESYATLWEEVLMPMSRRPSDLYVRAKKYFGFATSANGKTSRSELYGSVLQVAVKRFAQVIVDEALVHQILGLVIRNGRVDHAVGEHDDLVIGWLMTHWFLSRGKNLRFYGIDPAKALAISATQQAQQGPVTFQIREQERIRIRLQELLTLMQNESSEFLVERYEKEVRGLEQRLVLQDSEHFSLDQALNYVREQRRKARPMANHQEVSGMYSGYVHEGGRVETWAPAW